MNRRSVLRLAVGAAALPLVSVPTFASGYHIADPIVFHFKTPTQVFNPLFTLDGDQPRYLPGPEIEYRCVCVLRSDGLALAFSSPVGAVSLAAAKVDAYAQTDGVRDVMPAWWETAQSPQVPICGYDGAWAYSETDFRVWVQELQASVDGWQ